MIKIKSLFIIILFLPKSLKSYPSEITILEKGKQKIFLFGDYHTNNVQTKAQVYATFDAAKILNALVIIEDKEWNVQDLPFARKVELNDPNLLNVQERYLSPLGYLCRTSAIECVNVEFRAIWDAFNNGMVTLFQAIEMSEKSIDESKNFAKTNFEKICKDVENDESWQILEKYKDLKIKEFLNKISIDELYSIMGKDLSKESNLKKLSLKIRPNKIKESLWKKYAPYADLLDQIMEMRILRVIFNNPDKENIFVCAGSYHTNLVKDYLQNQYGYKEIKSSTTAYDQICACKLALCCCDCITQPQVINVNNFLKEFLEEEICV